MSGNGRHTELPDGQRDATRVTRAGLPEEEAYAPALPGPVFAAHYHLPGAVADAPYAYGRDANPTWSGLERAIARLESPGDLPAGDDAGPRPADPAAAVSEPAAPERPAAPGKPAAGEEAAAREEAAAGEEAAAREEAAVPEASGSDPAECVVFASGMAAISAVLFSQLSPGETAVLPSDGYQLLPALRERLESFGVRVRTAPTADDAQLALVEGARLLWIESPSNPLLDVCDIRRLAEEARAQGALVAVDNTLATPLGQRPLDLGADFSVASGTKALTGHGDVLLGYVVCRDRGLAASVRHWRKTIGAIPGPMEAWLAHRSLATLDVRTQRQSANALAVAEALRARPEVSGVRHPGLPDDPAHRRAARQMRRFGCVVSCTLPGREFAERFLAELRLVDNATSFGGVRSMAERRARWGGDAVPEGFVRMSVGVEDAEDLVADLHRALDTAARHAPAATPSPPS